MERLTKRDEFGNADIVGIDSAELQGHLAFGEFNLVTAALNRFAAYEDTGLEPEEINEALKVRDGGVYEPPTIFGVPFEKVRELLDAERAGRLVVLPCKVRDMVFFIGCGMVENLQVYYMELHLGTAISGMVLRLRRSDDTTEQVSDEDFGKTVFYTCEEAEAALVKEKGETHEADPV